MAAITDANPRFRSASRQRRSGLSFGLIDLGTDPPIEAAGGPHTPQERRRVSLRWLAGTILTGLAGAGLVGAAIYAALDRQPNFAEAPEFAQTTRRDDTTSALVNPSKGDRLLPAVDIVAAKQSFRAPTTIIVGNKSVVQMRAFTRVATTLETTRGSLADEVPPFNPLKLITGAPDQPPEPAPDPELVRNNEEISFTTRDLGHLAAAPADYELTAEEIQAQIAEKLNSVHRHHPGSVARLAPQMLLMRSIRAGLDPAALAYARVGNPAPPAPFSSIAVRMVPENVTLVPRSLGGSRKLNRRRVVIVRHGDTLQSILRAAGATQDAIKGVLAAFKTGPGHSPVTEGQRLKLLFADIDGDGRTSQLARLSVYNDETLQTTIALDDAGQYVRVPQPKATPNATRRAPANDDANSGNLRLYNSFYETALKQNIPHPIIDELVHIFANDVDFRRRVSAADSLVAFYEDSDKSAERDKLLFASLTTRDATFKYFRFRTTDDGRVGYYDENGRSSRKFLLREPVDGQARMTSPFGMRFHPILGYWRMHTGVDWAAPIGTPIVAAGDGIVTKAGRESGYGNRVEVQHANGYITTYSHLEGFARGISRGVRVHQGQVIGYLGMTGLATGPHLHYEVIVNGHFVNPLRVKLGRTRDLSGAMLADFKRERDRILALMARAPGSAPLTAEAQR